MLRLLTIMHLRNPNDEFNNYELGFKIKAVSTFYQPNLTFYNRNSPRAGFTYNELCPASMFCLLCMKFGPPCVHWYNEEQWRDWCPIAPIQILKVD